VGGVAEPPSGGRCALYVTTQYVTPAASGNTHPTCVGDPSPTSCRCCSRRAFVRRGVCAESIHCARASRYVVVHAAPLALAPPLAAARRGPGQQLSERLCARARSLLVWFDVSMSRSCCGHCVQETMHRVNKVGVELTEPFAQRCALSSHPLCPCKPPHVAWACTRQRGLRTVFQLSNWSCNSDGYAAGLQDTSTASLVSPTDTIPFRTVCLFMGRRSNAGCEFGERWVFVCAWGRGRVLQGAAAVREERLVRAGVRGSSTPHPPTTAVPTARRPWPSPQTCAVT
jgi:hypothetical protein